MLTLNDGRSELWQWDTGRKLTVDADCSQVHFSNKVFGRSIDVDVVDGIADIPDTLLQTDKELTAWAFVGTAENGYTKISKVFRINKRNKPADYVFTEPDQTTLGEILGRIEDLENRPSADISKEDIQDAVNEYLDNNPVSVDEKDPTVPDWAKQPEPPKTEIPGTLPNPHKLTFSGAVSAEYDGSKAMEVVIPQGSGSERWRLIKRITVEEETSNIPRFNVDEDGKPFDLKSVRLVSPNIASSIYVSNDMHGRLAVGKRNSNDTDGNRTVFADGTFIEIGMIQNPSKYPFWAQVEYVSGVWMFTTSNGKSLRSIGFDIAVSDVIQSLGLGVSNYNNFKYAPGVILEFWGVDA